MNIQTVDVSTSVSPRIRWLNLRRYRGSATMRLGLVVVGFLVLVAITSVFWTPYDPAATKVGPVYGAPSASHWFGTDRVGADIFSLTMAGTRTDVGITITAVAISFLVGTFLGAISGFYGGWVDAAISRLTEVMQAFPTLLLAMLIVAAAGPGIRNVIIVVAIVGIPDYLRLARAEILSKKTWQFAEAGQMVGNPPLRLLRKHLLPNSVLPLIAYSSINASWVTGLIASLGFLGLGIEPGSAEWGAMIARGEDSIVSGEWWISFFPGLAIFVLAAAFYLIGDGITEGRDRR
jgi:peptide/nickel transport system permease protein